MVKSIESKPMYRITCRQWKKKLGNDAKMRIRNGAKKEKRLYSMPVELERPMFGTREDGSKFPINTLGKYVFGGPGYRGHLFVETAETAVELTLYTGMEEAICLIKKACDRCRLKIESESWIL